MNEDTLLLYYYEDGLSESERHEVRLALARDPALMASYARLCAELEDLGQLPEAAVTPDRVARWQAAIDSAARQEGVLDHASQEPRPAWWRLPTLGWGAALATALLLGVGIGAQWGASPTQPAQRAPLPDLVGSTGAPAPDGGAAFRRGLRVHFNESRAQLVDLDPSGNGERSRMVLELVQQNRLFEQAAEHRGVDDLARLLRAMEPLLLELAEPGLEEQEAGELRSQLEFELNVMLTRLSREASQGTDSIDT